MEILMLNVAGLPSTISNSRKEEVFREKVLKRNAHILCLVETQITDEPGGLNGYELKTWRPAHSARTRSGRNSGGLAIYLKRGSSLSLENIVLGSEHERYYLMAKVRLKLLEEEFRLCLLYLPAGDPPFEAAKWIISEITVDEKVIIVGDLNARTGQLCSDWRSERRESLDGDCNHRGRHLMKFLEHQNYDDESDGFTVILNGRAQPDRSQVGKPTYQGYTESKPQSSVLDYALVHKNLFEHFKFRVLKISFDFDHRPIVVSYKYSLLERCKEELRKVSFEELSDPQLKDIAAAYTNTEIEEVVKTTTKHGGGLYKKTTNMTAAEQSVKFIVKALRDEYKQEEERRLRQEEERRLWQEEERRVRQEEKTTPGSGCSQSTPSRR